MEAWLDDFYGDEPERLEERRGWKERSLVSEMKKLEPHHQIGVLAEFVFLMNRERSTFASEGLPRRSFLKLGAVGGFAFGAFLFGMFV